jgi:hypothetical protein
MLEPVDEERDEMAPLPAAEPPETGPPEGTLEAGWPMDPPDQLELHAEAFVRVRAGHQLPAPWRRPGFIREVGLVRAHLAPIRSRRLLAASFGREALHRDEGLPTVDLAVGRVSDSPVLVAYAIRWLELVGAVERPRPTSPDTEPRTTHTMNREGARARRSSVVVRLTGSRRRRLSANAVLKTRELPPGRAARSSPPDSVAEAEALTWFG